MAETFIFAIAQSVLGKLSSVAVDEFCLAWGLETDLKKLKEVLLAITAVLSDAEQKQSRDQRIELWLGQLKDFLYDIEDAVDEFECEALVKAYGSTGRKVRRFFSSSNPLVFRFRMAHQLKSLTERVDDIAKLNSDYSLADAINNRQVIIQSDRRLTHSFVDASTVIGRDKDKEIIILEYLLNVGGGDTVSILPIVGIGGLGKTTLAKLVYNDERVDSHFEKKVWVCVSDGFELKTVLIKIIKSAIMNELSERCENWDIDRLQTVLRDTFNNKRYLLVLDDVWNEDRGKWEELRAMLMGGASGSRILVTTRRHQVASMMCSDSLSPHELHGLRHEDCVSLFYKCAFKDVHEVECYPRLKQIGEQIVRKCKEVPLVVVTLGNSLFGKTDENDWKRIRDSEIWQIEQNENDILPALRISYEQLPSYLKRCFAYCSFFPKDVIYNEIAVVHLWMVHGLLQSKNDNEELEEIGL